MFCADCVILFVCFLVTKYTTAATATIPKLDDVTYFAQIRGGGLDLVKWKLPHSHDQTMNEATTNERRYTGSAGSAAR